MRKVYLFLLLPKQVLYISQKLYCFVPLDTRSIDIVRLEGPEWNFASTSGISLIHTFFINQECHMLLASGSVSLLNLQHFYDWPVFLSPTFILWKDQVNFTCSCHLPKEDKWKNRVPLGVTVIYFRWTNSISRTTRATISLRLSVP